jgi:ubiquinone/menaquinone biosynthesis C-methylase UbiE
MRPSESPSPVQERWQSPAVAGRYGAARWRGVRSASRDPRLVGALLDRFGVQESPGGILDVPCGTGRLAEVLAARDVGYLGVDVSAAMLQGVAEDTRRLQASVWQLPFQTDSFDTVVCCRLLHHLADENELRGAVRELVRVARRQVICSFWDSASLHAWRARAGLRRLRRDARVAISKAHLERVLQDAGAQPLAYRHSLRFVSKQAFVLACKARD